MPENQINPKRNLDTSASGNPEFSDLLTALAKRRS